MLHQTLTPPFFHLPFPSSSSIPPPAAAGFHHAPPPPTTKAPPQYFRSSQVEREEVKMECVEAKALKNGFRPEALSAAAHHHHHQQSLLAEEVAWAVERGGEDFSVDDLLDFGGLEPDKEDEQEEEAQDEVFEVENSNSSSSVVSSEDPLPSDIILPAHDEAELEWVSRIIDDSLTEFPPCTGVPPHRPAAQTQPQTKAHYELLPENYRTLTPPPPRPVCRLSTEALVPVKAKRSKRSRSTAGGAWPTFSATTFADSSASTTTTTTTSSSSSCSSSSTYSSCLIYNHAAFLLDGNPPPPKKHKPKKRGRKPKQPPLVAAGVGGAGERRCSHCGTQKTPQWRAGPMGSKTLCNACGVRFKSGRLLPEYRPACSPTFVSHVHSNSHRKVLEMRRKKEEEEEEHLDSSALPVSIF